MEGKETLKELVRLAGDRITILVGSGVRPDNAQALVEFTHAKEIHGSCKVRTDGGYEETDTETVKQLIHILNN